MMDDSRYFWEEPLVGTVPEEEDVARVLPRQITPALTNNSSHTHFSYRAQNRDKKALATADYDATESDIDGRRSGLEELF